ncbi:hypothetical protein WDZ17_16000 [Pseudokineococcus basanitobsidens]|uniref:MgtE-like protein n=1 Tax=Pseudokineococcus basanitobsidens TaxID=1926649 RepID=A0ABU8RP04_9ACTN
MSRRRRTAPRRDATRRPTPTPAPVEPPPVDVAPADGDLASLVAAVLCRDVGAARTGLEAELAVTGVLGPMSVVTAGLELDGDVAAELLRQLDDDTSPDPPEGGAVDGAVEQGDEDDIADELATSLQVVERLAARADVDALAALRVLSSLGLPPVRTAAGGAADRLAAAGLTERPWAAAVGRPRVVSAWRWSSPATHQESLGVLYAERGREHALLVLVDHALGGGIRDLGLLTGRRAGRLRQEMASTLPSDEGQQLEALPVEEVAPRLATLLERPVCPGEVHQVDDVTDLLMLVRARAAAPSVQPPARHEPVG